MNLLLIGGSGRVGRMIKPYLSVEHRLRVLDRAAPSDAHTLGDGTSHAHEYVNADVTDHSTVRPAMTGVDAVIFLAMGPIANWETIDTATAHFDVSVKGLYVALRCAAEAGIRQIIYTSSVSVYATPPGGRFPTEDVQPDAHRFYGLTKLCGERVCRAAVDSWDLDITALRLAYPTEQDRFVTAVDLDPMATSAADTANAYLAALRHPGSGLRTYAISGDTTGRFIDTTKAWREIGWQPMDVRGERTELLP